jgi:hypothetical protein
MMYIDRRFLFPVVAATAWAQQAPQPSPAAAEAEAALRARVEQFYKLQVDKKYRQAESMVADDSKDDYYNRAKQNIEGFSVQQIELLDNDTRARVTVKGKVTLRAALLGAQQFELPLLSSWKVENGQWVWWVDPEMKGRTPFGTIQPTNADGANGAPVRPPVPSIDIKTLKSQVTTDHGSVTLNASHPEDAVIFTNHLPGAITLEVQKPQLEDVSVRLEKSELKAGETSALRFRLTGKTKSAGVVEVRVSPLNETFQIPVQSN